MVEGWRDPAPQQDDVLEWEEPETPVLVSAPRVVWPLLASASIAAAMVVWVVVVAMALSRTAPGLGASPLGLVEIVGAACVPLVLGAVLLLAVRQSDAVTRVRLRRGLEHGAAGAQRLDQSVSHFSRAMTAQRGVAEEQAARWDALAHALTDRTSDLTEQLDRDLAALDGRLERVDAAAAGARRDLGSVLSGLPKVERQTRELASSLRDAGLTAHEGASALDAQLGLLRHRAGEADEVACAATARLVAQLARMEDVGEATAAHLRTTAEDTAATVDGLLARADESLQRSGAGLVERGHALAEAVDGAEQRMGEAGERAGAQMAARIDLLDERVRAVVDRVEQGRGDAEAAIARFDGGLTGLDQRLDTLRERSARDVSSLTSGLERLGTEADALTSRIGTGEEAMTFALTRAESLLGALDAAARELDETLPASFGRFERSAGEGFQRLAESLPELERYHALSDETVARLKEAAPLLGEGLDRLNAIAGQIDGRIDAAKSELDALAERADSLDVALTSMANERAPRLGAAIDAVRSSADGLGRAAADALDAALPEARDRLIAAVVDPLASAIDQGARARVEAVARLASEAVERVEAASERLREELERIEETGRLIAERQDHVLATVADEGEAGFSRRVALLLEALNSTAIDVSKVLSNDVSDTAWAAYLKGDRGVFTRRAVRLLDAGEAREILRSYEEDGEFRGQVNRYVHDFEALLRTVLADPNGSPMAVTLLSSDTGKLYVALAQAIERLRD